MISQHPDGEVVWNPSPRKKRTGLTASGKVLLKFSRINLTDIQKEILTLKTLDITQFDMFDLKSTRESCAEKFPRHKQCNRETFMVHQTIVWWVLYSIAIYEISHRTCGPSHRKCSTIFVNIAQGTSPDHNPLGPPLMEKDSKQRNSTEMHWDRVLLSNKNI